MFSNCNIEIQFLLFEFYRTYQKKNRVDLINYRSVCNLYFKISCNVIVYEKMLNFIQFEQ